MSMTEFLAAEEGYLQSRGVQPGQRPERMTRARLNELHAQYPDVPNYRRIAREKAAQARGGPGV